MRIGQRVKLVKAWNASTKPYIGQEATVIDGTKKWGKPDYNCCYIQFDDKTVLYVLHEQLEVVETLPLEGDTP